MSARLHLKDRLSREEIEERYHAAKRRRGSRSKARGNR